MVLFIIYKIPAVPLLFIKYNNSLRIDQDKEDDDANTTITAITYRLLTMGLGRKTLWSSRGHVSAKIIYLTPLTYFTKLRKFRLTLTLLFI